MNDRVLEGQSYGADQADVSARVTGWGRFQPMCMLYRNAEGNIQKMKVAENEKGHHIPFVDQDCGILLFFLEKSERVN